MADRTTILQFASYFICFWVEAFLPIFTCSIGCHYPIAGFSNTLRSFSIMLLTFGQRFARLQCPFSQIHLFFPSVMLYCITDVQHNKMMRHYLCCLYCFIWLFPSVDSCRRQTFSARIVIFFCVCKQYSAGIPAGLLRACKQQQQQATTKKKKKNSACSRNTFVDDSIFNGEDSKYSK